MRKLFFAGLILASTGFHSVYADSPEEGIALEAGLVHSYIWRGCSIGGQGFQASIYGEFHGNESQALEVEAWGYTDIDILTKELDLSLTYSFFQRKAAITLCDYWYVSEEGIKYDDYANNSTAHTLEAQLSYTQSLHPEKNHNLRLMWATAFYGNDKKLSPTGNYQQAYSSYFEIKYEGVFLSPNYGCEVSMGFSPWASPMNYMVEKFSWINAEWKLYHTLKLIDAVELMPSVTFTIDPAHKKTYISWGVAFSL